MPKNSVLTVGGTTELKHTGGSWAVSGRVVFSGTNNLTSDSGVIVTVNEGAEVELAAGTVWVLNTDSKITGDGSVLSYGHVEIFTDDIDVDNILSFRVYIVLGIVTIFDYYPNLTLAGTPVFHSAGPLQLSSFSIAGNVQGKQTTLRINEVIVLGGSLSSIYVESTVTTINGNIRLIQSSISHQGTSPAVWESGSIVLCYSYLELL